jgi:hypothetical protein
VFKPLLGGSGPGSGGSSPPRSNGRHRRFPSNLSGGSGESFSGFDFAAPPQTKWVVRPVWEEFVRLDAFDLQVSTQPLNHEPNPKP